MGYETKLIIGTLENFEPVKDNYFSVISTINLCQTAFCSTWISESDQQKKNESWFYEGNKKIRKDKYGCKLYALDPIKVLEFMKGANKKEPYRRYRAAIGLLEPLIEDFKNENLRCILYGY